MRPRAEPGQDQSGREAGGCGCGSGTYGRAVSGAGAVGVCARAVFTNYVTATPPAWAGKPWVVWSVFGGLLVLAVVLQML
jgi:hypothetical protein